MSAAALAPLFTVNTWSASSAKPAAVNPLIELSVQRLVCLLDESGEDDYGKIGPSQFAFKNALLLVVRAITMLGEDVPSSPVVDSQGGIRVTWRHDDRQIKLICPATRDAQVYIYQSSLQGNSLRDQNVTAAVLAERLAWLIGRESSDAR